MDVISYGGDLSDPAGVQKRYNYCLLEKIAVNNMKNFEWVCRVDKDPTFPGLAFKGMSHLLYLGFIIDFLASGFCLQPPQCFWQFSGCNGLAFCWYLPAQIFIKNSL